MRPDKRERLANAWHSLGGAWLWQSLPTTHKLTIIAMRRVGCRRSTALAGMDPKLIDLSPGEFEKFVRWLSAYTNPVSLEEAHQWLSHGTPLPSRATLLTFDHDYKDNLNAAELMAHYQVPGVFFISPTLIEERRLGWWEQLYSAIYQTAKDQYVFDRQVYWLPEEQDRLYAAVINSLKDTVGKPTKFSFEQLITDLGTRLPSTVVEANILTIEDLCYLQNTLQMTVGVSTTSLQPPVVGNVELQLKEMRRSKAILETWVQKAVTALAYPWIGAHTPSETARYSAMRAGYQLAMTTQPEPVNRLNADPFALPRFSSKGNWYLDTATIAHPTIFGVPLQDAL
jgi:peptidoglycan/xylan/chitin deacetylase (PgdA/CDA1 family)